MSNRVKSPKQSDSEEEKYSVEVFLAARYKYEDSNGWEYLIRWWNFDASQDSWEPEHCIAGCPALRKRFWKEIGINGDRPGISKGALVRPSKEWIRKERKRAKERNDSDNGNQKEVSINRRVAQEGEGASSKTTSIHRRKRADSDSSEDIPMALLSNKNSTTPNKRQKSNAGNSGLKIKIPPPASQLSQQSNAQSGTSISTTLIGDQAGSNTSPKPPSIDTHDPGHAIDQVSQIPAKSPVDFPTAASSSTSPSTSSKPNRTGYKQQPRIMMQPYPELTGTAFGNATKMKVAQASGLLFASARTRKPLPSFKKKADISKHTLAPTSTTVPTTSFAPMPSVPHNDLLVEASDFLTDVLPPMQESSLHESSILSPSNSSTGQVEGIQHGNMNGSNPSRTHKPYRWNGRVFCTFRGQAEDAYGGVTIMEHPVTAGNCMPWEAVLPSTMTSVHFAQLHHAIDISRQLKEMWKGLSRRLRVGLLYSEDGTTKQMLTSLATYAIKYSLVLVMPVQKSSALLVFFPPLLSSMRSCFHLSEKPSSDMLFSVALVPMSSPLSLSPCTQPACECSAPSFNPYATKGSQFLQQNAATILNFPPWLHSYLSSGKRHVCIWYDGSPSCVERMMETSRDKEAGSNNLKTADFETQMLTSILQEYNGKNRGYYQDTEVVFVHVSALKTLHRLVAFTDRIYKRSDTTFVTYGTHYSIAPSLWGFRRIYRYGGFVMFSPTAFLDDPLSLFPKVLEIADHRLWTVWLTPLTLGYIAKARYPDDALDALDHNTFAFRFLLDAIDEGRISFGKPPPHTDDQPALQKWLAEQTLVVSSGPREILAYALQLFDAKFAKVPLESRPKVAVDSIYKDMLSCRLHPALMENHRRFIILCATEQLPDQSIARKDCIEWKTQEMFSFSYVPRPKARPQG